MNSARLFITAFSILGLTACSSGDKDKNIAVKPTITVSIEPQRQILEQLAGDRYEIVTLLSRGSDPETFDPSIAVRRKADKSVAYFSIGSFPFEEKIKESLPETVEFINISKGIEPIYGTHGHSHSQADSHTSRHEDADPHIWTSAVNMKKIAINMADALCRIDSASSKIYAGRIKKLESHIDSLDRSIASKMHKGNAFAIWHPSLSYFARDYALEQVAVGYESKEMPAKKLKEVIDMAKGHSIKVFFFQKEYDSRQAESLNDAIGSRLIEIDPLAYDWETELIKIADELARP